MEKVYPYTITEQEIFENIFTHKDILMNHVVVPSGQSFPRHPTDAVVYILIVRGELSMTLGDQDTRQYRAGQVVNVPKGVESILGNYGDDILEMFVVKTEHDQQAKK